MTESVPQSTPRTDAERSELLERSLARHHYSPDALIEILHSAQELYGYLPPALLGRIARSLKLPPSRVLGVATFYHLFRFAPRQAHTAVVCVGTACYESGAGDLVSRANACGRNSQWTVELGRCVGSCGLAPVAVVDGVPHARVTPAGLEKLFDEASRREPA